MQWYEYLAYFVAGAFSANGVPHFVHGISGQRFQSPFASPPGIGKSSPLVNVLWGFGNFLAGAALLSWVGGLTLGLNSATLAFAIGALAAAVGLAWHFGRVRDS